MARLIIHPGEHLADELKALGMSANELAKELGVPTNRITEIILNEDGKGTALFSRLSKDYEYGFELIRDKTGQRDFIVTRETVDDPEGYLNRMIREIYKRQSDQRLEDKD